MATFTGQLHPKRKSELQDIADALGLETTSNELKTELEDMIEDALTQSRQLREDNRFSGLWEAIGRRKLPRAQRSQSNLAQDADESDETASERSSPDPIRLGQQLVASPRKAVANVTSVVRRQSGQVVKNVAPTTRSLKKFKSSASKAVSTAQDTLNSSWNVTALLLSAEFTFLAWSAVPWQKQTFGSQKWLTRSPTAAFSWDLPSVMVLSHPTFLLPTLRWTVWSILVPLAIATVIAFPRGRRSAQPAPPNPVVFNVVRAALVVLVQYIFAPATTDPLKWSFAHVHGYPALQLLGSGVGTLLTFYDTVGR